MLTHDDMDQLRGLIREEMEAEGKVIRREIVVTNTGTKADLARLSDQVKSLDIIIAGVNHKLDQTQAAAGSFHPERASNANISIENNKQ